MRSRTRVSAFPYGPYLLSVYTILVWILLENQSLPFPLGAADQQRVIAALQTDGTSPSDSWIADLLDPMCARLNPRDPFPLISFFREFFLTGAVVGLAVGAVRNCGWVIGSWVGVLSLGFLPLRILAGTLAPHCLALCFLVWGFMLSLGRPWSKTGTPEQFIGGSCLGISSFAAPWAFLYSAVLPLQLVLSKTVHRAHGNLRRKSDGSYPLYRIEKVLELPFWTGLLIGLFPGVIWFVLERPSWTAVTGLHLEGVDSNKLLHLASLIGELPGPFLLLVVSVGAIKCVKYPSEEWHRWAVLTTWPLVPSLLLGYANHETMALAFPGLMLLAAAGFQTAGKVFVNRTESKLIPSLLVLCLGYHTFFSGLPLVRQLQAYSREVASLAELTLEKVPTGDPVAFFRLNSLIEYLEALNLAKDWRTLQAADFPDDPRYLPIVFEQRSGRSVPRLWLDPKRLAENGSGLGPEYLTRVQSEFKTVLFVGKNAAELLKVDLRTLKTGSR